jgi:hypothetical protein
MMIHHLVWLAAILNTRARVHFLADWFNGVTASWQRERFRNIANALRVKKQKICIPAQNTLEWLQQGLSNSLINAACGYWDNLEACDPISIRQTLVAKARTITRGVVVAVIPLTALVVGNRLFDISLQPEVERYILLTAIVWAVVNVLLIVDPKVVEKLEGVQGAASIFLPGLSKKD